MIKKILTLFVAAAFSIAMIGCQSCHRTDPEPQPEPVFVGYDFNEVIINDYDYIASQFEHFQFRSAEARFDSVLAFSNDNTISYVSTWFQCGEFVNTFFHTSDTNRMKSIMEFINSIGTEKYYEIDTTDVDFCVYLKFSDAILECAEINARNPITFDSCMTIVEPYRDELHTRALTLRRFLDPREPENTQYIFGTGNVMVDAITGEVSSTKDNEAIKPIVFEQNADLHLDIE